MTHSNPYNTLIKKIKQEKLKPEDQKGHQWLLTAEQEKQTLWKSLQGATAKADAQWFICSAIHSELRENRFELYPLNKKRSNRPIPSGKSLLIYHTERFGRYICRRAGDENPMVPDRDPPIPIPQIEKPKKPVINSSRYINSIDYPWSIAGIERRKKSEKEDTKSLEKIRKHAKLEPKRHTNVWEDAFEETSEIRAQRTLSM
ncbi:hypothetical protein BDA99DRAFT_540283 [Phascolomyces articulosus]|uniref:Uncharacterized protein n=1 Tax=Phascolomyces articulosus TaxID=60185 RepID=A0AAD5PB11_9FUNG|nr:hypothetical protein BDA99DRAFT_540283 [Phascolomyces articulosus]